MSVILSRIDGNTDGFELRVRFSKSSVSFNNPVDSSGETGLGAYVGCQTAISSHPNYKTVRRNGPRTKRIGGSLMLDGIKHKLAKCPSHGLTSHGVDLLMARHPFGEVQSWQDRAIPFVSRPFRIAAM
ncbi:hypothetical protein J7T55_009066 [Diaporthe amygdali]|uniref:uncharacterized protein n=1 Tax=Phomopsis amygdali TaxID=1214568 RepID=UPI0022FE3B5A|nr:uncharacterized protein J7T55_009066 [Diaporthe amygdali]KAJ0118283.1 hypothetical protein J7T55_009066 [Diaporthe amygdali]